MKFVVSHLPIGRLGFQYDKSRPNKITTSIWAGGRTEASKPLLNLIFKGEQIHPNQLMVDSLQLEKSNPPKFRYLNPGADSKRPVMIELANKERHNGSGLGHFVKFKLDDLLQHFTDATLQQKPTNVSSEKKILEIVGRKERIKVDLILEGKEKSK